MVAEYGIRKALFYAHVICTTCCFINAMLVEFYIRPLVDESINTVSYSQMRLCPSKSNYSSEPQSLSSNDVSLLTAKSYNRQAYHKIKTWRVGFLPVVFACTPC